MRRPLIRGQIAPVLLVGLALFGPPAWAQPARFLHPESYQPSVGGQATLRVVAGAADKARVEAWPADRVAWFFTRVAGTQENRDQLAPSKPGDDFVTIPLAQPGSTMIGLDLRPTVSEFTGAELERFIEKHIAPESLPAGRKPHAPDAKVRVRRVESAKLLLRVAGAAGKVDAQPDAPTALSKSGQQVEMRLIADPLVATVGSDIPLWTYIGNAKRGGVKVIATHVASGQRQPFLADSAGSGRFKLTQPGLWRVEFHHAEPLAGDAAADWVIYSATLAFEAAGSAK